MKWSWPKWRVSSLWPVETCQASQAPALCVFLRTSTTILSACTRPFALQHCAEFQPSCCCSVARCSQVVTIVLLRAEATALDEAGDMCSHCLVGQLCSQRGLRTLPSVTCVTGVPSSHLADLMAWFKLGKTPCSTSVTRLSFWEMDL